MWKRSLAVLGLSVLLTGCGQPTPKTADEKKVDRPVAPTQKDAEKK